MTKFNTKAIFAGLAAAVMLTVSGIFGSTSVNAEDNFPYYLLTSPAKHTLGELEPGKTYDGTFLVRNVGTEDFDFKVYAAPYHEEDEHGKQVFETSNKYTYLSEWITFDRVKGSLKPQTEMTISYRVKVPSNAVGGAQNAAIMVETDTPLKSKGTVSASARAALILFSQVNGEINECGKIVDKNIPTLLLNPPITASGRVENCGNIDLNVKYVMDVYSLFGSEPIYSNESDPKILATLPETRRYTNVKWEGTPAFGIFNVRLSITYAGKVEKLEKLVIVCPLWLIVLIIVFIGAVVFWLVSRSRSRKEARK